MVDELTPYALCTHAKHKHAEVGDCARPAPRRVRLHRAWRRAPASLPRPTARREACYSRRPNVARKSPQHVVLPCTVPSRKPFGPPPLGSTTRPVPVAVPWHAP